MSLTTNYIRYMLRAKTRHGIHSPFVYDFVDKELRRKCDSKVTHTIEQIRINLLEDSRNIDFEDLGAGSKKVKTTQPKVKQLAKNSLKGKKYASLVAKLASYVRAKTIIELGTSLGTTTLYLSLCNPQARIYTIEGSKSVAEIAREQFARAGVENIQSIIGNFDREFPKLLKETGNVDFIFIDGNHTYEATMRYFKMALEAAEKNTVIVFDDINWSAGMQKAWQEIKKEPKVRISMDFFFVGAVFFNPNFSKEDFLIRY